MGNILVSLFCYSFIPSWLVFCGHKSAGRDLPRQREDLKWPKPACIHSKFLPALQGPAGFDAVVTDHDLGIDLRTPFDVMDRIIESLHSCGHCIKMELCFNMFSAHGRHSIAKDATMSSDCI